MSTVQDGTGQGFTAKVDKTNRLLTRSASQNHASEETALGNGYNFNTGSITLTSANKSALVYAQNGETDPLVITGFFYLIGESTSGSGNMLIQVERNPTGGTITSGTDQAPVNRNFSSSNTLSNSTFKKGAEVFMLTGGTVCVETLLPNEGQGRHSILVDDIILGPGDAIGITITPAGSNTSQAVMVAMSIYKEVL